MPGKSKEEQATALPGAPGDDAAWDVRLPNAVQVEALAPPAVLPEHLRGVDLAQDVWNRVKSDPFRKTTITRLRDDPEAHGMVRDVLMAAQAREIEILLHHQARVFGHVLTQILGATRAFLGTSWAPKAWRNPSPAPAAPAESAAPSWPKRIGTALLTPKYFLTGLVAVLMLFSGWSQLQINAQRESLATLRNLMADLRTERDQLRVARAEAIDQRARLATELKVTRAETLKKTAGLSSAMQALRGERDSLKQQLDQLAQLLGQAVGPDGKAKDEASPGLTKSAADLLSEMKASQERAKVLEQQLAAMTEREAKSDEIRAVNDELMATQAQLNAQIDDLRIQASRARSRQALLPSAEETLERIRRIENAKTWPDNDVVRLVGTYFDLKQTLSAQ